jgi:hypothetical protein
MSPAAYAASLNPEESSERVLQKVGP